MYNRPEMKLSIPVYIVNTVEENTPFSFELYILHDPYIPDEIADKDIISRDQFKKLRYDDVKNSYNYFITTESVHSYILDFNLHEIVGEGEEYLDMSVFYLYNYDDKMFYKIGKLNILDEDKAFNIENILCKLVTPVNDRNWDITIGKHPDILTFQAEIFFNDSYIPIEDVSLIPSSIVNINQGSEDLSVRFEPIAKKEYDLTYKCYKYTVKFYVDYKDMEKYLYTYSDNGLDEPIAEVNDAILEIGLRNRVGNEEVRSTVDFAVLILNINMQIMHMAYPIFIPYIAFKK